VKLNIGDTTTYEGIEYQLVRWPVHPDEMNACTGCALNSYNNQGCKTLSRLSPEDDFYYCVHTVYILNTPEARIQHAMALLELA